MGRAAHYDRRIHVARRFTLSGLRSLVEGGGFKVQRATYFNTLLFPAIFLWRKLGGLLSPGSLDLWMPPAPLNAFLTAVLDVERMLLRAMEMPFGGSVAVVAMKPRERE
jgi:hypothetical protein